MAGLIVPAYQLSIAYYIFLANISFSVVGELDTVPVRRSAPIIRVCIAFILLSGVNSPLGLIVAVRFAQTR